MTCWVRVYVITLVIFLSVDAVWLTFVGGPLYDGVIGPLLAERFRVVPAVVFYLLHVTGILVLVLPRARGAIGTAAAYGAMFGLCTYGTYDLTNHAALEVWSWQLTMVDMAWGSFVTGLSASAGAWVQGRKPTL